MVLPSVAAFGSEQHEDQPIDLRSGRNWGICPAADDRGLYAKFHLAGHYRACTLQVSERLVLQRTDDHRHSGLAGDARTAIRVIAVTPLYERM
jgi:hypothetical protein